MIFLSLDGSHTYLVKILLMEVLMLIDNIYLKNLPKPSPGTCLIC